MSDEFSELPQESDCPECCEAIEEKTESIKVVRTCAATTPADELDDISETTKTDRTYDCTLQPAIVNVNAEDSSATFFILVENASVYLAGSWIEFLGHDAATFRIVSIDDVANSLTLSGLMKDNITLIPDNPLNGYTIQANSCFVVCDEPDIISDAQKIIDVEAAIAASTGICMDSIPKQGANVPSSLVVAAGQDPNCVECGDVPDGDRFCINKPNDDAPQLVNGTFQFSDVNRAVGNLVGFSAALRNEESSRLQFSNNISESGDYVMRIANSDGMISVSMIKVLHPIYLRAGNRQDLIGNDHGVVSKTSGNMDSFELINSVPTDYTHARLFIKLTSRAQNNTAVVKDSSGKMIAAINNSATGTGNAHGSIYALAPITDPNGTPTVDVSYLLLDGTSGEEAATPDYIEVSIQLVGYEAPTLL